VYGFISLSIFFSFKQTFEKQAQQQQHQQLIGLNLTPFSMRATIDMKSEARGRNYYFDQK
jgi:hypothetical protein